MIYEPVIVGSVEDALLGDILNGKIEAVVIYDGIPVPSQHDVPLLREFLATHHRARPASLAPREVGVTLARVIKRVRPELDIYLLTDRQRGEAGGRSGGLDDPARLLRGRGADGGPPHVLEGVADRFYTPYFDNLKNYARGRSARSTRCRSRAASRSSSRTGSATWASSTGRTCSSPRSSATTGGLDSLLEPTGNIKVAQEKFARAVGADHVFFVTNGTSTSNKMVYQAVTRAGRHRDRRPQLPQVAPLRHGALRARSRCYVEAFPMTAYSMYGAVPLRTIKKALLDLKAEGQLDRAEDGDADQLHVRRPRLQHAPRDGRVPRDQARPDLPVGRGVVRLRALVAVPAPAHRAWVPRRRSRNGARPRLRSRRARRRPRSSARTSTRRMRACSSGAWFRTRARCASASTRPTRCTSRCRRCARARSWWCATRTTTTTSSAFHEAVFTHASTSPNLQIIASLDVARRQMELEGYELVMRAIEIALRDPPGGERASAHLEVLSTCSAPTR